MTVTKILGEQSGIQYQGVVDKSETDPRDALINALFTGEFKNGTFNKPFKVTQANIRAKLGFDPDNLQYQAIEDLLKQGAPFVWVMRVKSGSDEGASIDTSDLTYPEANGVIAFKLSDPNKRILINVNGYDIKGPMAEVIDQLAIEYKIYITYLRDGQILFTTSNNNHNELAIQGVDSHNRMDNYFTEHDSDEGYCDVSQFGDIYTFALTKTRDYCVLPTGSSLYPIDELDLDDTRNISMAASAVNHSKSNLFFDKVMLNNWVDGSNNPMTLDTVVEYYHPVQESLTFAQVRDRKSEYQYGYTYERIVCYTLAKAINDLLNIEFLYFSSNISEFGQTSNGENYSGLNENLVYMDFSKENAFMLKGYMPVIGRPS